MADARTAGRLETLGTVLPSTLHANDETMADREVINLEHSDEDEPVATPTTGRADVIAIDDDSQLEDSPGVEIIDVDAPTPPSPRGQKRKKDDKAAPAMRSGRAPRPR